jgi:hypothetical protein
MSKAKFFTFYQNNSGGSFTTSDIDGICEVVIIEASNADHANERAEKIGLYFNGVAYGMDCGCCGDRWYPASEDEGKIAPLIYGTPIEQAEESMFLRKCFVHYLDGTKKGVSFKPKSK